MYIPCFIESKEKWVELNVESFTLQSNIDPKIISKKFSHFKFSKYFPSEYLYEFGFCDEAGSEYCVHCYKQIDRSPESWGTVVTIYDSINPVKDVTSFSCWLSDNFTRK